MDFLDLREQQQRIREDLHARINRVLAHGQYILGPEVVELEEKLAAFIGRKFCVSCANGTDALLIPLMALGIGAGDAVFVPAMTFVATAEVVALTGATPVFVDSERRTFNLSPADLERAINDVQSGRFGKLKPRALIPVDLYGHPADYEKLDALCRRHALTLIEDAAQGLGAEYRGKRCGAFGTISATSFFPSKPLGCYGDGGAMFCDDAAIATLLRSIRVHGKGKDKYDNVRVGLNSRLDTLQAAVLLAKFELFPAEIALRNEVAARYSAALCGQADVPAVEDNCVSAWAQYTLRVAGRDALQKFLAEKKIPSVVYYPVPLHKAPVFAGAAGAVSLPVAEELRDTVLSLPMSPYLSETDQKRVVAAVQEWYSSTR